jgi:hypothetical protein
MLPRLGSPVDQLWDVLLDLGALPLRWTLIGGQMVLLHALEHGQVPSQISQDGDVVADVRADPSGLRTLVGVLAEKGLEPEMVMTDGRVHRYLRSAEPRPVVIDVLAPEGMGRRTDLTTTPPGHTIQVPGGTQALDRTEVVEVRHGARSGLVPRPSLLGAIVAKAAACALPGDTSRHERDLALLCALVPDPFTLREQMTGKDVQRVRAASALAVPHHSAWRLVAAEIRDQGVAAYAILTA